MASAVVDIEGIVQGVGFRPFLFNLAKEHGLTGWIQNRGNDGVRARVDGEKDNIDAFLADIPAKKPPVARVDDVRVTWLKQPGRFKDIQLKPSEDSKGATIVLPADIATCDECVAELMGNGPGGTSNKYYQYPFVSCSACGPRFTTVTDMPYDREKTTMVDFPLCKDGPERCVAEYSDPDNRRFHAQSFSCPRCGPHYQLLDGNGCVVAKRLDALRAIPDLLVDGQVVAMKGIGGVHLVADACNDIAVDRLRNRKRNREFKPFAVMVAGLDTARRYADLSSIEEEWLVSHRRPIVLVRQRSLSGLSAKVAPGLANVGLMLPYMGTHHLLFEFCREQGIDALVVTSGNLSGLPMAIENDGILMQLKGIADAFLLHDRRIEQRCDDSVGKVVDGMFLLTRRSRGFVPEYIPSPVDAGDRAFLAVGPELHATAAILRGNKLFPTQYIGDVENLETLDFLQKAVVHFRRLLRLSNPDITGIACDAHPLFHSTTYASELADELGVPLHRVLHHHAHCAALAVDQRLDPEHPCVYITCDGVGYGADGNAWGGEIFAGKLSSLQRVAQLQYRRMPGGDACVTFPGRMLASILRDGLGRDEVESQLGVNHLDAFNDRQEDLGIVLDMLDNGDSLPLTSSTGRVLDAASVLLGASKRSTYEGEPAIRLEGLAASHGTRNDGLVEKMADVIRLLECDGSTQVDCGPAFQLMIDELAGDRSIETRGTLALAFQAGLGLMLGNLAVTIAARQGIDTVGFTGGVSLNEFILPEIKNQVIGAGLQFARHEMLPPGDGGVSCGQAVLAYLAHVER
jgi:hydrogenase maturation protein HypF